LATLATKGFIKGVYLVCFSIIRYTEKIASPRLKQKSKIIQKNYSIIPKFVPPLYYYLCGRDPAMAVITDL